MVDRRALDMYFDTFKGNVGPWLEQFKWEDPYGADEAKKLRFTYARMMVETLSPSVQGNATYTNLKAFENKSDFVADCIEVSLNAKIVITPRRILEIAGFKISMSHPVSALENYIYWVKYEFRGCFQWGKGSSVAFSNWLKGSDADARLSKRDIINCWEFVLYPAILTGLIPKGIIKDAYDKGKGFIENAMLEALNVLSTERGLGGVIQTDRARTGTLLPGDIIFVPEGENASGSDLLQHVVVVVEPSNDGSFESIKVMQLWGSISGGIADWIWLSDILPRIPNRNNLRQVFTAVRLGGNEPLTAT